MEVGTCHDGLCDSLSTDGTEARCSMGASRPTHQVGTFSSHADDLHTGGILQAVYMRDSPVTWSASLYCIEQRSQVYGSLSEELIEVHGYAVDNEYCISSTDGWSVGENHIGVRRHATSMRLGYQG